MKKKINSKHIFDNYYDCAKFLEHIQFKGFRFTGYCEDGAVLYSNAEGYTMYIIISDNI